MAPRENHETLELANLADRLTSAADGITNHAAVGLAKDLRAAAGIIGEMDKPVPLFPKLASELAKIANTTTDVDTQRRLRRLIGEA